jgi:regulatory protein
MAKIASRTLSYEQALQRAASLCSTSEHCIYDITNKLKKWGICTPDIDKIIDRLIDEKFIDESRYARAYVNDKFRFAHWGRVKIKNMLYLQHIPEAEINEALSNIPQYEYEEVLKGVIESKQRTLPETESYEARTKIIRFAIQRGFELHEITKFIDES